MKPFYKTDRGILYHGDCLDIMPELKYYKFDMVLCDPPYGTTACKWDSIIDLDLMWLQLKRLIKDNGAIALFGTEPFSSYLRMSSIEMFKYDWVWEKPRATGHLNAKKRPMRCAELISVFYGKQCYYDPQKTYNHKPANVSSAKTINRTEIYGKFEKQGTGGHTDRYPRDIIKFNNVNSACVHLHPTQKPVALFEYCIKTYTNENDIILDFACGSGTTAEACENLGRYWICIEKELEYCETVVNRLEKRR